jgi:glucose/arabinose dehydrogenase
LGDIKELLDCRSQYLIFLLWLVGLGVSFNVASAQEGDENGDVRLRDPNYSIEIVADGLADPTGMAFIDSNDILVLEKGKGTVQRILDGQKLDEPLLDVNVNSEDERGLLGIAIAKNDSKTNPYVFLYYTEAEGDDEGDPLGNRLYRYELIGNKLVNPKLLLDLPSLPGPAHNGGVVAVGPDHNIYVAVGDMIPTSYGQTQYQSAAQNYENGKDPDGRGGILRVTQDGEVVGNKGILGDNHPLDKYFAYGIRNSFGIAFDPLTGNLWDTENGPSFGDEINLVDSGFNSGWAKILGIWSVNETINADGNREVIEGHQYTSLSKEPGLADLSDLVDFGGHGNYSDPELTWEKSIGPTSITFLNSDKLGKEYENDLFMGNVRGQVYHFDLVSNRTKLDLSGPLSDKVVQDPDETESSIFGSEFGIITDMEVGPDGNLYVVSGVRDTEGKVYRISPSIAGG